MAKKWIAGAIKHPGALHKELHVPDGKKIPAKKLAKAEHSKNPTERKRAQLAETLGHMHHGSGPRAEGVPGYEKPAHHTAAIKEMPHTGPEQAGGGYEKPEHHEASNMGAPKAANMIQDGIPLHRPRPANAHGFGHGPTRSQGHLRTSGHRSAHQIGRRK